MFVTDMNMLYACVVAVSFSVILFLCNYSYSSSVSMCAPLFSVSAWHCLCLDYGKICNMLHCMSIIHVPSILSHFFSTDGIKTNAKKENRKMCWAHTKKQKERERKTHFLMSQLWIPIPFCCWRTHFFMFSVCVQCTQMHAVTLHGKKRIYHENCRKCGTRIKEYQSRESCAQGIIVVSICQWPYFRKYRQMEMPLN